MCAIFFLNYDFYIYILQISTVTLFCYDTLFCYVKLFFSLSLYLSISLFLFLFLSLSLYLFLSFFFSFSLSKNSPNLSKFSSLLNSRCVHSNQGKGTIFIDIFRIIKCIEILPFFYNKNMNFFNNPNHILKVITCRIKLFFLTQYQYIFPSSIKMYVKLKIYLKLILKYYKNPKVCLSIGL